MPIKKMIFFGSRAQGHESKYSDVDLIIVSDGFRKKRFFERPFKLYADWDLDYPVDFLCYTPEEFEVEKRMITIVKEALRKGIEI